MSRNFLTSLNLNKNELLNAAIQSLSIAPSAPAEAQIYYNTGTKELNYWDGTSWIALSTGSSVDGAIQAAIDLLTADDIEEGTTNLYYTDARAKADAAALLTGATQTNISITGDGSGLTITAENGVADSTTDDLTEGTTNKYFTDERALAATASAYDPAGSASQALSDAQAYTDSVAQGLNVKLSVRTATSADITLENLQTINGVELVAGDRVLVKNQATATENGIYVVVDGGPWTRAADADPVSTELKEGAYTLVTEGSFAATGWVVTGYVGGATTWTQFSAANEYSAGTNISIVDNTISVDGVIPVENGGTGADTADGARANLGATTKYAENNGALTAVSGFVSWVVSHGLGTSDVTVQVREIATNATVEVDVAITDANTVTLAWVSSGESANTYRVVIVG